MFQRNVSTDDIENLIKNGEVIEEHLEDNPCPSVLILGYLKGIPYDVVIAECKDHLRVITAYRPGEDKWVNSRIRK